MLEALAQGMRAQARLYCGANAMGSFERSSKTWYGIGLAVWFTACGAAPPATRPPASIEAAELSDSVWRLRSAANVSGQAIAPLSRKPGEPFRLAFSDGQVSVRNGCNQMGGSYRLHGQELRIANFTTTLMACEDPRLMEADAALAERLNAPAKIAITLGQPRVLTLTSANGDVLVLDAGK